MSNHRSRFQRGFGIEAPLGSAPNGHGLTIVCRTRVRLILTRSVSEGSNLFPRLRFGLRWHRLQCDILNRVQYNNRPRRLPVAATKNPAEPRPVVGGNGRPAARSISEWRPRMSDHHPRLRMPAGRPRQIPVNRWGIGLKRRSLGHRSGELQAWWNTGCPAGRVAPRRRSDCAWQDDRWAPPCAARSGRA